MFGRLLIEVGLFAAVALFVGQSPVKDQRDLVEALQLLWNKIFANLGIRSNSQSYSIAFRQPLERSPQTEFALGFSIPLVDGSD